MLDFIPIYQWMLHNLLTDEKPIWDNIIEFLQKQADNNLHWISEKLITITKRVEMSIKLNEESDFTEYDAHSKYWMQEGKKLMCRINYLTILYKQMA